MFVQVALDIDLLVCFLNYKRSKKTPSLTSTLTFPYWFLLKQSQQESADKCPFPFDIDFLELFFVEKQPQQESVTKSPSALDIDLLVFFGRATVAKKRRH